MAYPQGTFNFPGVIAPISGRYHCGHGVQPGRIALRCAFQETPVTDVGDLTIFYGGQSFPVRDCKVVERISFFDTNDGHVTEFLLEDRRWRWRFGQIEGHYNLQLASGKIDEDCERTPQQLAKLLFEAMKEQRFDYSALNNVPRPEVRWVGANPALELQRLADVLGARLVYDPLSNTVAIRRAGEGRPLPNIESIDQAGSNLIRPAVPNGILVVGNTTRVQQAVPITPLLEDTDSSLKDPRDVSYVANLASDTGEIEETWFYKEGLDFANISDEAQRKLCQKTMWRYYKLGDTRIQIIQYLKGTTLRIEDVSLELNEEYEDEDGEKSKTGYAVGIFNLTEGGGPFIVDPGKSENTSTDRKDVVYEGGIQIVNDHDFPYIIFSRPVWKWTGDGEKRIPDQLWLVCTFAVRNVGKNLTCSQHHFSYFSKLNNEMKVGPEVYTDESLVLRPVLDFNRDDLSFGTKVRDNLFRDQLQTRSREIAQSRSRRYQTVLAGNAVYQEFILVNLDGAIQSVVWKWGEEGATTEVYRNSEPDFVETKYDRRLTLQEIRRRAGVP